jgi:hypothetical protein
VTPTPDSDWQTAWLLLVGLWLLFALIRGWVNGPLRLLVKPAALLIAWLLVRTFSGNAGAALTAWTGWPAPQCTLVAGCILAFLSYQGVCLLGRTLFKRTRDHASPLTRTAFGVMGAGVGLFYGLLLIWATVVMIRFFGHFAAAQTADDPAQSSAPSGLAANVVRLQASVEAALGRPLVEACDPVPRWFYRRLEQTQRLVASPVALERFLTYPGFEEAWHDSRLRAIEADPVIVQNLRQGRVWPVLADPRIWDLLGSPAWWATFSGPRYDAALRYALDGT